MSELNFPQKEKEILNFWKREKIFEKSISQRKKSPDFVFYEGPPTANAKPGIHHVLSRVFKDIICRYKTMQNFRVERKAGWDTHGLPVELEIEKKLGIKSKKEIEKYGIAKFNKACKKSVWDYKKDWEELTERIAFWLNLKDPYITYSPDYIETLWWILKEIWKKGLLYKDYKVVPYCPRCGTSLSSHEVSLGYKKVKEPAIYVKLRVLDQKDTFLLVWTTTPWTLPANVAVAVNPNFKYVILKVGNEKFILAKERVEFLDIKGKLTKEFLGKELEGLKYQPLFEFNLENLMAKKIKGKKRIYEVILADFVSLKEGTGLVHLAPAFGEEDLLAIRKENLKKKDLGEFPIFLTVDEEGKFKKEIEDWKGIFIKEADPLIIENLKKRNLLFKEELYEHDYPFCWRCKTPLLYYAKESWFIKMTQIKEQLIKNNQKVNWVPSYIKEGRFGTWLREIKDWALSRERYWGTPLPVWECKKCQKIKVIGSFKEILNQKFSKNTYYLFRHGHSLRQVKNFASCWPEKEPYPLTEKGKKEVLKSARQLKKIDLIFSSDLLRAKQTAQIISQVTGAKIIFDKRLREVNVGIFNGKNPKLVWDFIFEKKDPFRTKVPKGESLLDIQKRTYNFIKAVDKKYQGKKIVIVSHELPLTILEKTLKGWDIEKIIKWRRKNRDKTLKTGTFKKVEFKLLPFNEKMEIDFHRPFIDKVKFFCPQCGQEMERVKEVIDCWFDSGSMPFAQFHYPFSKKKIPFPADYICEGIDQTRGWFYTLLAVSTLLGKGPAYKNVISLGHVLDEKGEKMSKSKGNVVDPWQMIEKYGVDTLRWYFYTINQPGDPKLFSEKDIKETLRRFILIFWNCFQFFQTYREKDFSFAKLSTENILDKWIISKLNGLIKSVTEKLENYDITGGAREIEEFVIKDLSLWYIRRSRNRFQRPETKKELKVATNILGFVLFNLSKLLAPFLPFLSERIYQELKPKKISVHLEDWPKEDKKLINEDLEREMEKTREIVSLALAERKKAKIKVRQPLKTLKIKIDLKKEFLELIKDEVNVKEVLIDKKIKNKIELDTKITPDLKEEGMIRELVRNIQLMRKLGNLSPKDKILVYFLGNEKMNEVFLKHKNEILKEALIKDFVCEKEEKGVLAKKEILIEGEKMFLAIKKVK